MNAPVQAAAAVKEKLAAWFALCKRIEAECKPLIEQERTMRAELFATLFPAPKEGTNTYDLGDGYEVKGKYPIDRKVDATVLDTLRTLKLRDLSPQLLAMVHPVGEYDPDMLVTTRLSLNLDTVVKWEPKLETKPYRELTDEQRAIFERCLTSKPGSIALEVVKPKPRGNAAEAPAAGFGGGPESL